MRALANLDILGEFAGSFKGYAQLPENPRAGQWALIGNRVSVCIEIQEDNLPVWFPITNEGNQVVYEQQQAEKVWEVKHDLGSEAVLVQCFDSESIPVIPDSIEIVDGNNVRVTFSDEIVGRAYVLYGVEVGRDITQRTEDNQTKSVGGLKFESIEGSRTYGTFLGKLETGQLVAWGYSYDYAHGQGDGGVEAQTGYTILELPYFTGEVIQYGQQYTTMYALMDTGELFVWGGNSTGQQGLGHKNKVKVPTKTLDGVAEVLHQDYTVRDWDSAGRYMLVKMIDGSIKVAGFTGDSLWTEKKDSTTWQDIRLPDGITFDDIKFHYFNGYSGRRAHFIQTHDLRVFVSGRNYHGSLGVATNLGNDNHVDWEAVPELYGKEIVKMCGWYGWLDYQGKYPNGSSCTYALTSDGDLYHAGKGYNAYLNYITGYPKETNPVTSDNYMRFIKIHENVSYIEVHGSPGAVFYIKDGKWYGFGHSHNYHRVTSESSDVTVPEFEQVGIPLDAKLGENWAVHTETWQQPTVFFDEEFLYIRGTNNYGSLGLGDDVLRKDLVKFNYREVFDGKLIRFAHHGVSAGNSALALTERGSLYAVGYGGRGAFFLKLGNITDNKTASYAVWQHLK